MTYDKLVKAIGKRVKQLRVEAGYTSYEDFAKRHDLHRMTMHRIEAGKSVSLRTLNIILQKLGVSYKEFFDEL